MPKLGFLVFFRFGSLVFFEIGFSDSLQQYIASTRGKNHEKKIFRHQIWAKWAKIRPKICCFFCHFLNFGSLIFL